MRFRDYLSLATLSLGMLGCEQNIRKQQPNECLNHASRARVSPADELYSPRDFIRDDTYTSFSIEVDAIDGVTPPSEQTLQTLENILSTVISKPDGIVHLRDELAIPRKRTCYSLSDLKEIEYAHRSTDPCKLSLYILYVNGEFHDKNDPRACGRGKKIIGITSKNAIFIFREQFSPEIEKSILMHEIGHVLGLVHNGTPLQKMHEDPEHPGHDLNEQCVMYYLITSPNIYFFDTSCLNDIKAVREE